MAISKSAFLIRKDLTELFELLLKQGFRLHGPQVRDGAIVYDDLDSVEDLPQRWTDQQVPGLYRLKHGDSPRQFNWANGPSALKPLLYPARDVIWQARRGDDGRLQFLVPEQAQDKVAIIGVKACDLAALKLQDQHFLEGEYVDPGYQAKRQGLFLIAVNCNVSAETCFCVSTGDGPEVRQAYDILLTELDDGFLIQSGSAKGSTIVDQLPLHKVSEAMTDMAKEQIQTAANQQTRSLNLIAKDDLQSRRDHPQWDDVAERCLACGNCTMVCPTCFCHRQHEEPQLNGAESEHVREWDSCFGESHGQLAGFQVRQTVKQRYQQWMIHKLDTWQAQYGRSGCTGCGRCMTWCPAEIDFVAEANLITGDKE
ncbi:4Fe-4S dicluster domain-containing protein [Neptuniibacter sp. QD34_54]|uniref:4Fe-4S dicluster domain-containing protein n=1 Tax=Neptuniibacter sp. QD34_54 TaxID=3398208 RepID=UPI0039F5D51D